MREQIVERLNKVFAELHIDITNVTDDSDLTSDLGLDSLDNVELIMCVEEEFGVEIPDEDSLNITTYGQVVKYIEDNL